MKKKVSAFIQFIPIWLILTLFKVFPMRKRSKMIGAITRWALIRMPKTRRRADDNLARVFPDKPLQEREEIRNNMGRHIGQTLGEILFNKDYRHNLSDFHADGPGLAVLRACKSSGQGAIIVSGHFGQWEAIRHYLKSQGMETGAVYRPTANPFYERYFLSGIKLGGEPIVARGTAGMRSMIKTLRQGGFMAILIDQRQNDGVNLPFLGHDALTSTAAADLALKLDIPMVPVFAERAANRADIAIQFEEPISRGDALEMTMEANTRLEQRVIAQPDQWFWVHKRWKQKNPKS